MASHSPDHSFPSSHRLLHAGDFDAVFKENDFRISRPEVLILAKQNGEGFNRLGMVISKKNFPLAVTRNLVKRRIREAFRCLPHTGKGVDIVVMGRRGAESVTFPGIIQTAFKQLLTDQCQ